MKRFDELSIQQLKTLKSLCLCGTSATYLSGITLLDNPVISLPILLSTFALLFNYKKLSLVPSTSDEKELNSIYNDILKDIYNLSNDMELTSVIENHELLNIMLRHDFLSSEIAECSTNDGYDIVCVGDKRVSGALSLNNHGVCRHKSKMEVDFMKMLGFNAQCLDGRFLENNKKTVFKVLDVLYKNNIISEDEYEFSKTHRELFEKAPLLFMSNHRICKANDNLYTYYLDLEQDSVYSKVGILYSRNFDFKTFEPSLFESSAFYNSQNMHTIRTKQVKSIPEIFRERNDASSKIILNMDMLRKFKNDHHYQLERAEELYRLLPKRKIKTK